MNKYRDFFFKEFERRVGRLRNTLFILVLKKISVNTDLLGHVLILEIAI